MIPTSITIDNQLEVCPRPQLEEVDVTKQPHSINEYRRMMVCAIDPRIYTGLTLKKIMIDQVNEFVTYVLACQFAASGHSDLGPFEECDA
jgi:hypothetical protein